MNDLDQLLHDIHSAEGPALDVLGSKMQTHRRELEPDAAYRGRLKDRAIFLYATDSDPYEPPLIPARPVPPALSDLVDLRPPKLAHDPVNHPAHYTEHPSGVECITVVEWFPFNLGNAVKYVWRAGLKVAAEASSLAIEAKTLEDLRKARWYLDREISRLEEKAFVSRGLEEIDRAAKKKG